MAGLGEFARMGEYPQKLAGNPVLLLNPGARQPIGGAQSVGKGLNLCPNPSASGPGPQGSSARGDTL